MSAAVEEIPKELQVLSRLLLLAALETLSNGTTYNVPAALPSSLCPSDSRQPFKLRGPGLPSLYPSQTHCTSDMLVFTCDGSLAGARQPPGR
jgi:hypothetical protein